MRSFVEEVNEELTRVTGLISSANMKIDQLKDGYLIERKGIVGARFYESNEKGIIKKQTSDIHAARAIEISKVKLLKAYLFLLEKNQKLLKKIQRDYLDYDVESVISKLPATYKDVLISHAQIKSSMISVGHINQLSQSMPLNQRKQRERNVRSGDVKADERIERNLGSGDIKTDERIERNRYDIIDGSSHSSFSDYNTFKNTSQNITLDGTVVRSLGEMIIYNALLSFGIPFRYEAKLELTTLDGFSVVKYPDFTIETKAGHLYWEHVGYYDDPNYRQSFEKKIKLYYDNDIVMGSNLIVSFSKRGKYVDSQSIYDYIKSIIVPKCQQV